MANPGPSFISENSSQKKLIGTDKISEIVNDSDSTVVVLVNFLTVKRTKQIHPLAAVAVKRQRKKLCSASQRGAGREHSGPFLNAQIQIWSWDG
jgi:hypothetical protein